MREKAPKAVYELKVEGLPPYHWGLGRIALPILERILLYLWSTLCPDSIKKPCNRKDLVFPQQKEAFRNNHPTLGNSLPKQASEDNKRLTSFDPRKFPLRHLCPEPRPQTGRISWRHPKYVAELRVRKSPPLVYPKPLAHRRFPAKNGRAVVTVIANCPKSRPLNPKHAGDFQNNAAIIQVTAAINCKLQTLNPAP